MEPEVIMAGSGTDTPPGTEGYGKIVMLQEVLQKVNKGKEDLLKPEELSRLFLEEVGGQALCFLKARRKNEPLMPRLMVGNHTESLKACYYSGSEGLARQVLERDVAIASTAGQDFEGDILLQELSRSMGFEAAMASPVNMGPRGEGLALVFGLPHITAFGEDDKALLESFCGVLSLLFRHQDACEALQRRTRELDGKEFHLFAVYQVSKALSSIIDMEKLTSIMADMLVEILGVTHSLLFLTDENEEKMHIKASRFLDPATTAPAMEITVTEKSADWLTSQNFESRALLSFDDEKFNEAFPDAAWIFQQQKIAVAIPMIYNYKLVGFLALGGKYMGESLQARDIDFLSTVAPMAASAISNVYLYEMAILDGLTKVFMGRYFRQRCREEVQRARRYKKILSIIMWDLDHFKDVNDTHGHLAGDAVLTEIATIFRKSLRQGIDMVARYGGEEFVMLLPDTPGDGAMIMAERLRRNISRQKFWDGKVQLTVSGGIASFPEDGTDYLTLIEQADIQLYRAKRDGRNRVRIRGLKRGPAPA